jgi:hypothetical protein
MRDLDVSIATSLAVALSEGPVHFVGQARTSVHSAASLPSSSRILICTFWRASLIFPLITFCRHFHNSVSSVMPRLSVMLEYFCSPTSLSRCVGWSPSR